MDEKKKPNTKCVECGKTYYSVLGGFHKEDNEEFYYTLCSKECAKKQGMTDEEIEQDEGGW